MHGILLFLHIFPKQTCCYLKSCSEGKQKSEMCLSGDMHWGKFPSIHESLLLRNLWWCFWSDIKHRSQAFKATAQLSAEGIGPITPGEGSIKLFLGDLGTCECQRLVFSTGNVAKVKWPLNCGTLHATTAARRLLHCEWSTATSETGKRQQCACKNVHNVWKRRSHSKKYVIKVILSAAALWIALISQ